MSTGRTSCCNEPALSYWPEGSPGSDVNLRISQARDPRFRVIYLRRNFGQSAAFLAGIDYARGEILVTMNGELQNDPSDIPSLLRKLDEGYDIVSGWRVNRCDRFLRLLEKGCQTWRFPPPCTSKADLEA